MRFSDIKLGMTESIEKVFSEEDVESFAKLVNDYNPVHLDQDYASRTVFKSRIVHGILVVGLISAVIGTKLPGEGSIYLGQNLKFVKPVFIGDLIKAFIKVVGLREDKMIVTLETICVNSNNEPVIEGEAIVKLFE